MDLSDDVKREISLEFSIKQLIRSDNGCHASLQFSPEEVKIITYNPRHNTYFLFDTFKTDKSSKCEILEDILDKLKHKIKPFMTLTYKIKWSKDGNFFTSHFEGCSLEDVCKKFYFKNNPHDYIIHSAELMPIS